MDKLIFDRHLSDSEVNCFNNITKLPQINHYTFNSFIFDNACTMTTTKNENILSHKYNNNGTINGSNSTQSFNTSGNIFAITPHNFQIVFSNVALMPNSNIPCTLLNYKANKNILSLGEPNNSLRIAFLNNNGKILHIYDIPANNQKLYVMNLNIFQPYTHKSNLINLNDNNYKLHCIFGHYSENYLKNLHKCGYFDYELKYTNSYNKCTCCKLSNICKNPISKKHNPRSAGPGEYITIDIQNIYTIGYGQKKYRFNFIDDYTDYTLTYSIKRKTDVDDAFLTFISDFKHKVLHMHSDGAGEFKSIIKKMCINQSITFTSTPRNSSIQNNSKVERSIRTVQNITNSLITFAGLPHTVWPIVDKQSCLIKNVIPNKKYNFTTTSFERLLNTKPNYTATNLNFIVGAKVILNNPNKHTGNISGQVGFALSYTTNHGLYVLIPKSKNKYSVVRENDYTVFNDQLYKYFINKKGVCINDLNLDITQQPKVEIEAEETAKSFSEQQPTENQSQSDSTETTNNKATSSTEKNSTSNSSPEKESTSNHSNPDPTKDMIIEGDDETYVTLIHSISEQALIYDPGYKSLGSKNYHNVAVKMGPNKFGLFTSLANMHQSFKLTYTYTAAMKRPDYKLFLDSMLKEWQGILASNCIKWVDMKDLPKDSVILHGLWINEIKNNRYKSRLVIMDKKKKGKRNQDEPGDEFYYAPTSPIEAVRFILILASYFNYDIDAADISQAFLNANLFDKKKRYFMYPPRGISGNGKIIEIVKALYGLRVAPKAWFIRLAKALKDMDLNLIQHEQFPTLYYTKNFDLIVLVHVDDFLITGTASQRKLFINKLLSTFVGKITDPRVFLGLNIKKSNGIFTLSSKDKIIQLLKDNDLEKCNGCKTPLPTNFAELMLKEEVPMASVTEQKKYMAHVGSLLFINNTTRPDLSFATTLLSRFTRVTPKDTALAGTKRTMRYLKQTIDFAITLDGKSLVLKGFVDAGYQCKRTRKWTSGWIIFLGNSILAYKSKRQSLVALSTCEAEMLALCDITREMIFYRNVLQTMNLIDTSAPPTKIYCDNKATIILATSEYVKSQRTKHFDTKYKFVRERKHLGEVDFDYVSTKLNIADGFTKILGRLEHGKFCEQLFDIEHQPDNDESLKMHQFIAYLATQHQYLNALNVINGKRKRGKYLDHKYY